MPAPAIVPRPPAGTARDRRCFGLAACAAKVAGSPVLSPDAPGGSRAAAGRAEQAQEMALSLAFLPLGLKC
jgi:hypothetical protein